jgi:hypothetical protein
VKFRNRIDLFTDIFFLQEAPPFGSPSLKKVYLAEALPLEVLHPVKSFL